MKIKYLVLECNKCGNEIKKGDLYVNFCLSLERELENEVEVIGDAECLACFHIGCFPKINQKVEHGRRIN